MADIKFGIAGYPKPTPSWIKNIFNALLYVSGVWAIFGPILTDIPQVVLSSINHYLLGLLPVMKFTISFFHYDYNFSDAN